MYMSHRWAARCKNSFDSKFKKYNSTCGSSGKQSLYGIIQGGVYEDLRKIACEETCSKNFDTCQVFGGSLFLRVPKRRRHANRAKMLEKIREHVFFDGSEAPQARQLG